MANDDNTARAARRIGRRIDDLSATADKLYQQTYSSRSDNRRGLDNIADNLDDNLDNLLTRVNGQEISDISNLYIRLMDKNNSDVRGVNQEINDSIEELFNGNKQILDTISLDNVRKSIQAEDYQYDLICRYMPKLEDALEIKKDNVLSSDNFTKEFINIVSDKSTKTFIDTFNDRATIIKDKYEVQELFEDMYYKASKYGEYFLYHVPYNIAFKRLLDRKQRFKLGGIRYYAAESAESIFESADMAKETKEFEEFSKEYIKEITEGDMSVKVIFDESGIIPEPIDKVHQRIKVLQEHTSLSESYNPALNVGYTNEKTLAFEEDENFTTDGLFTNKIDKGEIKDVITGSVLYEIPRPNIIPIYMDTYCIGYIYIQVSNDYIQALALNGNTYNSLMNNNRLVADDMDKQNDLLISHIAAVMSEKIDSKFINANVDLKEEIYAVLRYNDYFCCTHGTNMLTVTFLPVEDVHHFYFKMDKKTHRGISDLNKACVPAMIYCLLYLNTVMGQIGRSQDKRVYYVKQNVEQNVARTLLNVINQLKKGNMGMRQLENMNTIFNIIGRYNDHIIPMSQSGDSPIQMEVMQGQNIETPTDLMDRMEDMAVNSTDVPLEFVQSVHNVDYASRFTMSNSKFLRKVFKRQSVCQKHFTQIFRKLYNYEYKENDTTMKILLPAPAYLAMSNSQQLIDNIKNYANAIADICCKDVDEPIRNEFVNLYVRNQLGTYIDFTQVDDMIEMAKMNINVENTKSFDDVETTSEDEY